MGDCRQWITTSDQNVISQNEKNPGHRARGQSDDDTYLNDPFG
ncbi:hypothetical protein HMPREF0758_1739 [Serratia odorifera DSM 4582]|uniref:Uncharacterized protein n=1 Tax=Serratia odorifera DSM 4582 TaxID=667129 RepID=D4E0N9_SEROD|nr:hypothetical protein HMPREF0758_1739 [Serratia odorifera DSM 4582]